MSKIAIGVLAFRRPSKMSAAEHPAAGGDVEHRAQPGTASTGEFAVVFATFDAYVQRVLLAECQENADAKIVCRATLLPGVHQAAA